MAFVVRLTSAFVYFNLVYGTSILILIAGNTAAQSCPPEVNDEIQRCVMPVAQFAESLGVDVKETIGSDRLMPSMGAQVFRQLCSKISTFSTCVRKAKRQCPNHITLTLISASYGYLCTEGYEVFVKNADCLMRLDQEESVRYCHDRTLNDIKNSSGDGRSTMDQKLKLMCDSLNYFAVCVEQPVLRECGAPAWSVIARVLHDTTKTLMPACKFAVPVPQQSALLADAVAGEQASVLQSANSGQSGGRQKASSLGTMTTNSDVRVSDKGKSKSRNNIGGGSAVSDGVPKVGMASWETLVIVTIVSALSLWRM